MERGSGEGRAIHRNGILDEMEYELATRFLADVAEEFPADILDQRARRAVRARFTDAADDLSTASRVSHLFPGSELVDSGGASLAPEMSLIDDTLPRLNASVGVGARTDTFRPEP